MDDIGYVHPSEILKLSKPELRRWVADFEEHRYGGWRNHDNLWRETLGLDTTEGRHVIDFGCGFGIEALQFARNGNRITLMDLTSEGLAAAKRVLDVHGFNARTKRINGQIPKADIFYSNGVLHHTMKMPQIMSTAAKSCQEARLMVYSDRAFAFHGPDRFVRAMDEVGDHADWYSPDTLPSACPGWTLREATYITPQGFYLTATLDR